MLTCSDCSGFVPAAVAACPNCDAPNTEKHAVRRWTIGSRLARTILNVAGGAAVAMTLMACYGAPPYNDPCYDNDGDGYFPACYEPECDPADQYCDCDDSNPNIHPEADDPKGDNVDQNCDGVDGVKTPME